MNLAGKQIGKISRKHRDAIWTQIRDEILSNKMPDGMLIESFEQSPRRGNQLPALGEKHDAEQTDYWNAFLHG